MAGYGFDRNEVQVTKTTLIDKDGFIFETDKPYSEDPSDYDVIFIDYDGTVPYTYMADEFLAMKKFPPDPQHEGLISQGWNWDFDEAQAYVRKYGALVIGETYSPADGATQITIELTSRLHVPICFSQSVDEGVEIDWGDKSRHVFVEGTGVVNASHDYAQPGEYVLRLKAKDGCELGLGDPENNKIFFYGYYGENVNAQSSKLVKKIILSDSIKTFWQYAFSTAINLEVLIFSNSLESITHRNDAPSTGFSAGKIKNIILPKNLRFVTGLGDTEAKFEFISFSNSIEELQGIFLYSTSNIKIITLPEKITSISGDTQWSMLDFSTGNKLETMIIPDNVTSIVPGLLGGTTGARTLKRLYLSNGIETIGDKCFTFLFLLEELHLPEQLISVGDGSFTQMYNLTQLTLPETLESIGTGSFYNLGLVKELVLPDNCTSIGRTSFFTVTRLTNLKLPENIETLPYIFNAVVSLEKVVIPASVTSIDSIFNNALVLHDAVLKPTTPPTLTSGVFGRFAPTDLRIWVPYSSDHSILNAYKAVTGWSARADYIFELNEDGTIPDDI